MMSILARASVEGAILVAAVWVLSRVLRLTPATRTMLWWCAAAKFVVALAWTTPIAIPILPAEAVVVHRASGSAAPLFEPPPTDRGVQRRRSPLLLLHS